MKTTIIRGVSLIMILGSMFSCNFLDIDSLDTYTEKTIFTDAKLTESYVTNQYTKLRVGWRRSGLRFYCDEAMENFDWDKAWIINTGGMTPDEMKGLNFWKDYYNNIKDCNIFFSNLENLETIQEPRRSWVIGEATFLRAYYYMELVNSYGGVPLITREFKLDDPNMMVKRNSFEECANFIVDEFQKAADLLPEKFSKNDFGRATKGAALAMKSRMLLYAASPLWNPSNDIKKWEAAAIAAKSVIDLNIYSLDTDYRKLFLNPKSKEIIFQRLYTKEFGHSFDRQVATNGWGGYSASAIVQEMVDSYEMEDGTMPDPSLYSSATSNPWKGRDPRFYSSIVCDGQMNKGKEAEFWVNSDGKTGGLDSEYGKNAWNYSKTHYAIRKFTDESLIVPEKGEQPWIYSRFSEIYLNYAEALYHTGKEVEARKYINDIRKRARNGKPNILPDITASGADLLKKIQHERKIELAFEEHRFYDVRRWKIAEETDNGLFHGINITKQKDGTKNYKIFEIQNRKFVSPANYLLPIPRSEIQKNDLLEQNPGYI